MMSGAFGHWETRVQRNAGSIHFNPKGCRDVQVFSLQFLHLMRQPLLEFLAVHDAVLAISSFPHANQIAGLRAARTMLDMHPEGN